MISSKSRILIVDDSFFMRKMLKELLLTEKSFEVVGEANDGEEAISEAIRLVPDVITMDFNMPNINGYQAIVKILHNLNPKPAIIMISAHTIEGAEETFECLRAGAVDFITKPSGEISLDLDKIQNQIISKIKLAIQAKVKLYPELNKRSHQSSAKKVSDASYKVVVIGSSTGGPPVVENILSKIPGDINKVFFVAQHMPAHFTSEFAKRIDKLTELTVTEAQDGQKFNIGECLISPGGVNTVIDPRSLKIKLVKSEFKLTPSINMLMGSVANVYKNNVLGIILTGMGNDGLEGAKLVNEFGGKLIAQDSETSVIDSMPQAIIQQGIADHILNPEEIVEQIIKF